MGYFSHGLFMPLVLVLGTLTFKGVFSLNICVYPSNLGILVENVGSYKGALLPTVVGTLVILWS